MNNALISSGIGAASGSIAALIQWFFTGIGHPVPAEALPILVAGLVYLGHKANALLDAKFGVKSAEVTPAAAPQ